MKLILFVGAQLSHDVFAAQSHCFYDIVTLLHSHHDRFTSGNFEMRSYIGRDKALYIQT